MGFLYFFFNFYHFFTFVIGPINIKAIIDYPLIIRLVSFKHRLHKIPRRLNLKPPLQYKRWWPWITRKVLSVLLVEQISVLDDVHHNVRFGHVQLQELGTAVDYIRGEYVWLGRVCEVLFLTD